MHLALRVLVMTGLLALVACATTSGSNDPPKLNPQAQAVTAYRIGVDDECVLPGQIGKREALLGAPAGNVATMS